ncbi:hypothetical protein LTR28_002047 [Elasticomyces elasticus]|nr:hypothetical protein LTR28_002047 [Elasticomyces elasticus]
MPALARIWRKRHSFHDLAVIDRLATDRGEGAEVVPVHAIMDATRLVPVLRGAADAASVDRIGRTGVCVERSDGV